MSTSLLYHGFGLHGYRHERTEFQGGAIYFTVRQDTGSRCCPECGASNVKRRGRVMRWFRTLPLGQKPVWIKLAVAGLVPGLRGAAPGGSALPTGAGGYTRAFARQPLELSRHMTIKDVVQHLGVSWDVIKDIKKRHLKTRFVRPKPQKLKQIAIDEISIGKGHRYLTMVLDLKSGAVIFVGDGKGADAGTFLAKT